MDRPTVNQNIPSILQDSWTWLFENCKISTSSKLELYYVFMYYIISRYLSQLLLYLIAIQSKNCNLFINFIAFANPISVIFFSTLYNQCQKLIFMTFSLAIIGMYMLLIDLFTLHVWCTYTSQTNSIRPHCVIRDVFQ